VEGTAPRVTARRSAPGNPLSRSTLKARRAIHRRRGFRLEGASPSSRSADDRSEALGFRCGGGLPVHRFARSVSHLARALDEFRALGIEFVSLHEAIDTSTPIGRVMFHIAGAFAALELSVSALTRDALGRSTDLTDRNKVQSLQRFDELRTPPRFARSS